DTATTEIYTLSLHDALPICLRRSQSQDVKRERIFHRQFGAGRAATAGGARWPGAGVPAADHFRRAGHAPRQSASASRRKNFQAAETLRVAFAPAVEQSQADTHNFERIQRRFCGFIKQGFVLWRNFCWPESRISC